MSTPLSLTQVRSPSLFIALFCTLFTVIFNYTLSIMASPYIVGDLGGGNDTATYTVSFYALGNALSIPLGRILMGRFGTVRSLTIALLFFSFFSWGCAIAPNYPFFNAMRVLQGFSSGACYALIFHLFATLQPQEKKDLFTSISLTIFTIGPVLGASFGGWIAYEWDWRWVFYITIPLQLFLTYFLAKRLKGLDSLPIPKAFFDWLGYLTYFLAVTCLGIVTILGQELDWYRSTFILTLFSIGSLSLLFFIFWEINHPYPLIALKLLKNPVLFFSLLNLAVLFSAYFGMVILLSLWLNLWANYTPDWIGILIGTMAIAGLFPMFLVEKKLRSWDNRIFLVLAIILLAISSFHTMTFNVDVNFGRIACSRILAGFGLAFFLAPIFRLSFHRVAEDKMLHVLGLFQITRALSSGLGASFYATIWLRRQVFFHDRLGSRLTSFSNETSEFFVNAKEFHIQGTQADAKLEYYLQREAISLALEDCFYLMAWILVGLLLSFIYTFFLRKGSFITE